MYNILVLGSGGREHALSWKIAKSNKCQNLYIAPGNAGTRMTGTNLDIDILDFKEIEKVVDEHDIDYMVVGPEAPLVAGIYDYFQNKDVHVIGPPAASAALEGSKDFANTFMKEFDIPTAAYLTVSRENIEEGDAFIEKQEHTVVLKADGLAAGKGVLILKDKAEAKTALRNMLDGQFGDASRKVVLEEFLDGIEFSVFILTDGKEYLLLPAAKDYKRIGERDTGPNTGGMGAVSPVPFVTPDLMAKVRNKIIEPTLQGLQSRDMGYNGFIFFGLILVGDEPYVIEYNCRLGDPETEVIIPRLKNDLVELFENLSSGTLSSQKIEIEERHAGTIMLVSGGYPAAYEKGKPITLDYKKLTDSLIFHAGTKSDHGPLVTNGGRVIAVTGLAQNFREALDISKRTIESIKFEGMYYRKDIGFDLS